MKKKMALLLAAALTMTTILTGCGGENEENADKQPLDLMRNIRHTVIWMKTENIPDLTWSLHRQSVIWRAGNW